MRVPGSIIVESQKGVIRTLLYQSISLLLFLSYLQAVELDYHHHQQVRSHHPRLAFT